MTIEKARKVIGLNIHNLDEKMQMAVATIMDALEWSEEDEEKLKAICTYLRDYPRLAKLGDKLRFNEYCDFLKSLRPSWKPSEEQMEALMLAIEGKCPPTSYMSRRLEDLYEGLVNTYDIQENYLNNAGYSNHEQPSEDLEEEIKRYIPRDQCPVPDLMEAVARHFHELGKHGKEPHFTKRNALFDKCVANCDHTVMKNVSDEVDDMLRKEQMPMPEDTVIFQKGIEEGKRLMMEDALEGYIAQRINGELYAKCHIPKAMNFEFGDKIKIIIIGRANDAD